MTFGKIYIKILKYMKILTYMHENIYRIMAIIKLVEHLEYVEATFPFIYFYHLGPKNIYFIIETLRNDHGTFCIVYIDQDFTTLMFTLFVD